MQIKQEYIVNISAPVPEKPPTQDIDQNVEESSRNSTLELDSTKKRKSKTTQKKTKEDMLCNHIAVNRECPLKEECIYSHDAQEYLKRKEEDIGDLCINIESYGFCPFGLKCRFYNSHPKPSPEDTLIKNPNILNNCGKELIEVLRKKTYKFERYSKLAARGNKEEESPDSVQALYSTSEREKKTIDFNGKLYLAPLTTVGNLPFRRLCKELGADITCSEMALAMNLLKGSPSELALLKRHSSEDIFGAQICGGFVDNMSKCAELIQKEMSVDFIDINMACPIDMIYEKGMGSALLDKQNKAEAIVKGVQTVIDVPLTVKLRTGVYDGKLIAHKLIPRLKTCGVSAITIHGRTREQRYTKEADWDYITQCVSVAGQDLPILGSGDVLTFDDYYKKLESSKVSTILLARGALIKPWLFTEIKEKRHWDISSNERLELIEKYSKYGMEHFGSDTEGINRTRRFLLEWLSFLYRYVPVGLLETLPQKLNERPPRFFGRNELETLMASEKVEDWKKITEFYLGKTPMDFYFEPKHKSNSYQG